MADAEPTFVTGILRYVSLPTLDGGRPYLYTEPDELTGERKKNYVTMDREFAIENLRGKESTANLDSTGFQFLRAETKLKAFDKEEDIRNEYYPECVELLKKVTGASRVVVFDHTIRYHRPGDNGSDPSERQPSLQVHVDQSTAAAIGRVHKHLPPNDAESLLKKRFQIINIWRPTYHPAYDHPLAICDYRSIDAKKDLVPSDLVYPDRTGEILTVRYNPNHAWKYLRGMRPDEVILIKCYDSIDDGSVAQLTPHSAFEDPSTPEGSPYRRSIELRALVFYE